jgi:DNA-binding LacI/PurR family transcriptional regulator
VSLCTGWFRFALRIDAEVAADRLVGYRAALASAGIPFDPTIEEA